MVRLKKVFSLHRILLIAAGTITLLSSISHGDTVTNRLGLLLPTIGSPTWGQKINGNFQILDATVNIGGFSPGGGGSSSLGTGVGGINGFSTLISSPTSNLNFSSATFLGQLTGSSTAFITLNPSSVTLQGKFSPGNNIAFQSSASSTVINGTMTVYPATSTASFPFGFSSSTGNFSSSVWIGGISASEQVGNSLLQLLGDYPSGGGNIITIDNSDISTPVSLFFFRHCAFGFCADNANGGFGFSNINAPFGNVPTGLVVVSSDSVTREAFPTIYGSTYSFVSYGQTGEGRGIRLADGNKYFAIHPSTAITQNREYIWPRADGSSAQVLTTDGNGNLSWANGGGGGGTPGSPTTSVQFNNSGSFGGDANFEWDNINKKLTVPYVTTAATSLTMEQTGDTLGTTDLVLENRSGAAGAFFENKGLDLVDFGFQGNSGAQDNIRFEHRSGQTASSLNTTGEMQFIDSPLGTYSFPLAVGKNVIEIGGTIAGASSSVKVGMNVDSPSAMLHMKPYTSTTIGQIIQGASSQTGNLEEWQNSSGVAVSSVDASGNIFASTITAGTAMQTNKLQRNSNSNDRIDLLNGAVNVYSSGTEGESFQTASFFGGTFADNVNLGVFESKITGGAGGDTQTPIQAKTFPSPLQSQFPMCAYLASAGGDGRGSNTTYFGNQSIPGQDSYFFIAGATNTSCGVGCLYPTISTASFLVDGSYGSSNYGNVGIGVSTPTAKLSIGGHVEISASTPSLTSCGTSTIAGNDVVGRVTFAGVITTCQVNFVKSWNNAPVCVISPSGTSLTLGVTTTTGAMTIAGSATLTGSADYICMGYQ